MNDPREDVLAAMHTLLFARGRGPLRIIVGDAVAESMGLEGGGGEFVRDTDQEPWRRVMWDCGDLACQGHRFPTQQCPPRQVFVDKFDQPITLQDGDTLHAEMTFHADGRREVKPIVIRKGATVCDDCARWCANNLIGLYEKRCRCSCHSVELEDGR